MIKLHAVPKMHHLLRSTCLPLVIVWSFGPTALAEERAASLTPIYQFPGVRDGEAPWCNLVQVGGLLYGTTLVGGAFGRGAVFSVDPSTGAETLVYSFDGGGDAMNPQAGLTRVGSLLYGISNTGGANGYGAVYSIDPASGAEKVLFSLTPAMGGGSGSNIVAAGGYLYGTTYSGGTGAGYGVVFKVNQKTGAGGILYAFTGASDGASPQTGISLVKGVIYGTTTFGGSGGGGTIFAVNAATDTETTLYSFTGGADGSGPQGGVIDVGGVLYGTATYGGSAYNGTVFSYTLSSGTEKTLYNFQGGADGSYPVGPLLDVKGKLYGTANSGGSEGEGTVFALDPATGSETTLYSFPGGSNGAHPQVGVIATSGVLYGADAELSTPGIYDGTVFKIDLTSKVQTTLHSFVGGDNTTPASPVIDIGGTLYGTSGASAAALYGTIYKIDLATSAQTTSYTFTGGADGGAPSGSLTKIGNRLYGVASLGGANGTGGIFSFDPATATQSLVASFPTSVSAARGPLALVKGVLYGVTAHGGQNFEGTIFAYTPAKNALVTVHDFAGSEGAFPFAGLTASGSLLYGTTYVGGSGGYGTVFSFDPAGATVTDLHGFSGGADGAYPDAVPVVAGSTLYGTTNYGGNETSCYFGSLGCGVLYSITLSNGSFNALHSFNSTTDGASPGPLLADGKTIFGGTFAGGGAAEAGTLFSFDTATQAFATIYNFTGNSDGAYPAGLVRSGTTIYGVGNGGGTYGQGVVFNLTGF